MRLKVLIGGEESGTIRDAFIARGHDAMSCDLKPTAKSGPHYQGNVFDVIDYPWDLAIFHPGCTDIAVSGAHRFAEKRMDGRQQAGVSFFLNLFRRSAHIPLRAFENPVCIMSTLWMKPTQIVQPYQFGEDASKATCLWLFGLPVLAPTNFAPPRMVCVNGRNFPRWANQTDSGQNKLPPSEERATNRSKTYQGIADAMASQWGETQTELKI